MQGCSREKELYLLSLIAHSYALTLSQQPGSSPTTEGRNNCPLKRKTRDAATVKGEREIVGRSAIVFLRTCAIQRSRHVGVVRAEEQPHPKAKERHHGGDGVEEVNGEEVPVGSIVHVPFGVTMLGIDVEISPVSPRKIPVVAHFASSTTRRGIRHKQRKEDDQKGGWPRIDK